LHLQREKSVVGGRIHCLFGMGRKRTRGTQARILSDEQIKEVLENYDMECKYA